MEVSLRRSVDENEVWPPCDTCPKPDLIDENFEVWEMYVTTLWSQFRSDGMGGFISTDYGVFLSICKDREFDQEVIDALWLKISAIDVIRRKEIQAKQAPSSPKPTASSKFGK